MKISYQWLKEYVRFDLTPDEVGRYLTGVGLEVEDIERFETIKGGLVGLVIGEVLTCEPHPDSDHLHVTTVNTGSDILNIVCGASNVAAGQKVVVATLGTTLYQGEDSFTIKKSKIRGVVSEGMLCAEDEIGVGASHDGIMVLPPEAVPGTPAYRYFNVETDYIFEIGLTPNRSDAISHYGVARELCAALKVNKVPCSELHFPHGSHLLAMSTREPIDVTVENTHACPRYTGCTFSNITVRESPLWLQNRLRSIGVRPVNNVVDITQLVMFELGQPLHAFDIAAIEDHKIIVKNMPEGTPFITLDGNELKLSSEDLMICNAKTGMCIAGVYGGLHSGVTEKTTDIFLESAYFNPVTVRKTSKRHHLKTDAAFRYERGCDPTTTLPALRRAAHLLQEIANASVSSDIVDIYPTRIEPCKIAVSFEQINAVAGQELDKSVISTILLALGMKIEHADGEQMQVTIPLHRVDVTRPIDLIEEILRLYGYDNIEIPENLTYTLNERHGPSWGKKKKTISVGLAERGFHELITPPLTKNTYAEKYHFLNEKETVKLLNPLSRDLNVARQTLLFSGLEAIVHNLNNKNHDLRLFEFGNIYLKTETTNKDAAGTYTEFPRLSLFLTGQNNEKQWNCPSRSLTFFDLKATIEHIFTLSRIERKKIQVDPLHDDCFVQGLLYSDEGTVLVRAGEVHPAILKEAGIKQPVYYAEVSWDKVVNLQPDYSVIYTPVPQYPAVKRDLSIIVNEQIPYMRIEDTVKKYGTKLLSGLSLFDVYEGAQVAKGKRSYALNIVLQHQNKTLTEEEINKVMNKIIKGLEQETGATIR
ncbi:MAG: phenylalanine--tRNA ligase subunit beta [Bacteroidales bacterium]|nr:phenylalanine--tRNA ligase subunit beta [Bacteroidales bacterium]